MEHKYIQLDLPGRLVPGGCSVLIILVRSCSMADQTDVLLSTLLAEPKQRVVPSFVAFLQRGIQKKSTFTLTVCQKYKWMHTHNKCGVVLPRCGSVLQRNLFSSIRYSVTICNEKYYPLNELLWVLAMVMLKNLQNTTKKISHLIID